MLSLVFFRGVIGDAASLVVAPIQGIKTWLAESSATIPLYFRERHVLIEEIESLKEQNAAHTGNAMTIERLRAENGMLRNLTEGAEDARIVAGVIGRPPLMPYDVLMIDRGSEDGIRRDAIVYAHRNQAIGMVSAVYPESALVNLFSSPEVRSTVFVYGPDIYTNAVGEGGGVMRISVPQGIEISAGNTVAIPTLESGIVGKIREVRSEPTEPEQRAYVVQDIPLQSLRFVSVSPRVADTVDFETAREIVRETRTDLLRVDVPPEFLIEVATSSTSTLPNIGTSTNATSSL